GALADSADMAPAPSRKVLAWAPVNTEASSYRTCKPGSPARARTCDESSRLRGERREYVCGARAERCGASPALCGDRPIVGRDLAVTGGDLAVERCDCEVLGSDGVDRAIVRGAGELADQSGIRTHGARDGRDSRGVARPPGWRGRVPAS